MNDEAKTKEELISELAALRQREADLQERVTFLERVINLNPHFMFVKDREGRFILANQAFARAFANTTPEVLLGRTDAEFSRNQALVMQYRQDDLMVMDSGQDLFISEEQVVKPNAEVLWRETIKRPIVGPDGVAHKILGVVTDITERKHAQEALRESEERLRQVFSSISDHIYVTEFTETDQQLNRYMSPTKALTGYPLEKLLADWSFWPSKIIHPEDREIAAGQVERLAKGQNSEVEYRLIRADQRVIWVRDSARVEQDSATGSVIVYGVVSDITERKQAEEALREAEHRLRTVINNTPLILFALDQEGSFTLSEGQGLALIGLKPGEVVGQPVSKVYADYPNILDSVQRVLSQGEAHNRMTEIANLTFEIWYEPLRDSEGQVVGVVGVALDITERKEAEETIAQALERALEASRLKSQLLAKVSHELRTPLGTILGYTELVQSGEFGPISEHQLKVMTRVMDSTHYLTKMVNELLDQAQLEVGKVKLNLYQFALSELVAQVETKMSVLAQTKGLSLDTQIAADLPETLLGDPNRLQQILVNLVSNAIKFTKTGGIQICLYRPDPNHWAIAVADTGIGIPKEAQSYIFEPFQQVDGSVTREHVGTGLGLSIVKQLVHLMEGQIILESKVGQGSTFTVLLPLKTVEEKVL